MLGSALIENGLLRMLGSWRLAHRSGLSGPGFCFYPQSEDGADQELGELDGCEIPRTEVEEE